jgi:hypothetical protein
MNYRIMRDNLVCCSKATMSRESSVRRVVDREGLHVSPRLAASAIREYDNKQSINKEYHSMKVLESHWWWWWRPMQKPLAPVRT